jgi:hypothetical protein
MLGFGTQFAVEDLAEGHPADTPRERQAAPSAPRPSGGDLSAAEAMQAIKDAGVRLDVARQRLEATKPGIPAGGLGAPLHVGALQAWVKMAPGRSNRQAAAIAIGEVEAA